jgi:hypothetical protein
MVWVQFHDALRKGRKRALSRATRFIYMELSLEARPGRGVIELRADVSIAAAVHDLIGGDRREIDRAMPALMEEQPEDRAMIEIEESPGLRRLVVVAWESWNAVDISTERVRKHREEKKKARRETDETRFTPVSETVTQRDVTVLNKRREEIDPEPPPPDLKAYRADTSGGVSENGNGVVTREPSGVRAAIGGGGSR